jgi:hypothetical protein
MEARLRHREILNNPSAKQRVRILQAGLNAARSATYYAIRTGRDDVIDRAVWLYAFFLESVGAYADAASLLRNYIDWIDDEAPETKGATLMNLALVSARRGDMRNARSYLRMLKGLSDEGWLEKPLFRAVVEAQIHAEDGKEASARRWIGDARMLLDRLSPEDPWQHREELALMEAQLDRAR